MSLIEKRLKEIGLVLPSAPSPMANYVACLQVNNVVYTSGSTCFMDGKPLYTGRLGTDLTTDQGYEAAKITVLNLISIIKAEIGDLDRIEQIIKVLGLVSSAQDFYEQAQVINGASDLLVDVFGERGKHTRSALGTSVLPFNFPVEIEMIVQLKT
ncbi:RidA family protein [Peribacillus cavernae]|uniref:RidA family protein n=1 Tax=Peribacillus cavernae TaxID=1674310 RepID=A0A3S0VQ85_9BACI|nr:RidA family protein [Peribacillus cavernae]MDQ0220757.1 enamine deaminase RidA (YjgF/YER057c/UK114 family) [Peribacillus cavernae]RUQ32457.1 RidA family protein [Peribacillus cavernae]